MSLLNNSSKQDLTMEQIVKAIKENVTPLIDTKLEDLKKGLNIDTLIQEKLSPIANQLAEIAGKIPTIPEPKPTGDSAGKTSPNPETNAVIRDLQTKVSSQDGLIKQLMEQKKQSDQKAEQTERHALIRTVLTSLNSDQDSPPFISPNALETAFNLVEPFVRRLENGSVVAVAPGGDALPVQNFVKDFLPKEHPYLFKSTGAAGSGAHEHSGSTGSYMGSKVDLGSIKPGMTPEQRAAAVEAIRSAMPVAS